MRRNLVTVAGIALAAAGMASTGCAPSPGPDGSVGPSSTTGAPAAGSSATASPPVSSPSGAARPKVLFVRGGPGTAGVDGGPNDHNLSDIFGKAGQGFNGLSALLAANGFDVAQVEEGVNAAAVDLAAEDLSQYAVVVFGSNNARYDSASAKVLDSYVKGGGGALFFQDKNYGTVEGDAAHSDESLLSQYGVEVNRDDGLDAKYTPSDPGDWTHPLFDGVSEITGFGATTFTIAKTVAGVEATNLVPSKNNVFPNKVDIGERGPKENDAAVLVLEVGDGRVVGHFDRDTFFNEPVSRPGNRRYALNLIRWLAGI